MFTTAAKPETLEQVASRYYKLYSEMRYDSGSTESPKKFNLSNIDPEEAADLKDRMLMSIASLNENADEMTVMYRGATIEQQEASLKVLRSRQFEIDPGIEKVDVDSILAYIENHTHLDPRIHNLSSSGCLLYTSPSPRDS